MHRPATIDEVVDALSDVVDAARRRGDRRGLFAALYRRTTVAVRDAVRDGRFDDPGRMERLDVVFAHRYFAALADVRAGREPSPPWRYAFARAREEEHVVLQHLLLGVNAHIALDLAIAACDICDGRDTGDASNVGDDGNAGDDGRAGDAGNVGDAGDLASLERDFFEINRILAEIVDEVQDGLNAVSPALALLDRLGGRADERLAAAFLARARSSAWRKALAFAPLTPAERRARIARWERQVERVARRICPAPGRGWPGTATLLGIVRRAETDDVAALLDAIG